MTLIAAFRCDGGAVLCADTMETVEGFRMPVHKLEAKPCGNYWLAIAGSGNSDLIDGFAYRLELDIAGWKPKLNEKVIGENIRGVLTEFYDNEVRLYPSDSRDETRNNFIVCVKPNNKIGLTLWELRGSTIKPVRDYSLMGIGATLYTHELRKLYNANNAIRNGETVSRFGRIPALLLGIHLFSLAKGTSTYIGGDTDAVFVFDDREMDTVAPEDIRILEERVSGFDAAIAEIVLKCPDTTTQDVELAAYLDNFTQRIMEMRRYFAQRAAERAAPIIFRDFHSGLNPHLHMPENYVLTWNADTGVVATGPKDTDNPSFIQRKKAGRKKRV